MDQIDEELSDQIECEKSSIHIIGRNQNSKYQKHTKIETEDHKLEINVQSSRGRDETQLFSSEIETKPIISRFGDHIGLLASWKKRL